MNRPIVTATHERAAEAIERAMFGLTTPSMVAAIVAELDSAGLLVSPERDAAVADVRSQIEETR